MNTTEKAKVDNSEFPTVHELNCPVCQSKRMDCCMVAFDRVVLCATCGSIFSKIDYNKAGEIIKAIKIGERKYKPFMPPASVNEPLTMELGEPYFEMLEEPLVIEPSE